VSTRGRINREQVTRGRHYKSIIRTKTSPVGFASFQESGTVRKQCQAYFTLGFALRIQEEISRIPVDVLRRAMSSVHDRLAECEQRNGGHLEDVTSEIIMFFCSVLCFKTTDSLISANATVCTSL